MVRHDLMPQSPSLPQSFQPVINFSDLIFRTNGIKGNIRKGVFFKKKMELLTQISELAAHWTWHQAKHFIIRFTRDKAFILIF